MRTIVKFGITACFLTFADAFLTRWSSLSIGTLLSGMITAAALVLVRDGLRSRSRFRAVATIAWLYWGLSYLSNIIEAVAFKVIPVERAATSLMGSLVLALAVAGLLELMSSTPEQHRVPETVPAPGAPWRIALLAIAFFAIYLAAGIAIQPWIMSFYAGRPLPSLRELAVLVPCRGLLDIACIYPWFLQWGKSRRYAMWLAAYVFAALCGWGPLLLPNAYLPPSIRAAHAVEMGASGIVFGVLTALLLLRSKPGTLEEVPPLPALRVG